ncbi:MAG: UDP-2,3-diacylglucosamine diphosphatase LpxI [Deltaproteobacteria bacterium]|nr:UDP-2,3-diacylglucosamine diphosphatase LpxI [Deltaproteobacteria bacterium]
MMRSVSNGVTLIAGNGVLPALFAQGARRRGLRVCMVAHEGETEARSEAEADVVRRIRVGKVRALFRALDSFGNRKVAFVGGIRKTRLFADVRPDLAALGLLKKARDMRDDSLLRVLAGEIEARGFQVIGCTEYAPELLASDGPMGKRCPARRQVGDSRVGFELLSALSGHGTGQSVVVRSGVVLAVEAIEGTDAAIERAGRLGARGASLVKAAKKGQDLRFDVPAIGPLTVRACAAAGVNAIFLRSGETMLLGLEQTIGEADRAGISITGVGH